MSGRAGAWVVVCLLGVSPLASQAAEGPPGPVPGTRLTAEYVRSVARTAYFWAWPMVNVHDRVATFAKLPGAGLLGGILPVAPANQLAMLTDYVATRGARGRLPESGRRLWLRHGRSRRASRSSSRCPTSASASGSTRSSISAPTASPTSASMYGTKPGFYLLAGPDWKGEPPQGIERVFRSPTNIGILVPRAFMDDTAEDRAAVQLPVSQIALYPLSAFDGTPKTTDWKALPKFPSPPQGKRARRSGSCRSSSPRCSAPVLDEVPPLPGEQALYANFRAVLDARARSDPKLKAACSQGAASAEKELVDSAVRVPQLRHPRWRATGPRR